jgi:hypothetical protein
MAECLLWVDCVDKRFGGRERAILIHKNDQARNIDSKNATPGFLLMRRTLPTKYLTFSTFRQNRNPSDAHLKSRGAGAACCVASVCFLPKPLGFWI